eukprot:2262632-Ditylum_brightwellii.AAC.1
MNLQQITDKFKHITDTIEPTNITHTNLFNEVEQKFDNIHFRTNDRINNLNEKIVDSDDRINKLNEKIVNLDDNITNVTKQISDTDKKLKLMHGKIADNIESTEHKLTNIDFKLKKLKQSCDDINKINQGSIHISKSLNECVDKLEQIRGHMLKNNRKDVTLASDNLTAIEAFFDSIKLAVVTL